MSNSIFEKATSLFIEKWYNFKTLIPTIENLKKNYFNTLILNVLKVFSYMVLAQTIVLKVLTEL